MSREERRAYQRQMRGMERGASLPPAAKARAERNAVRRAARKTARSTERPGAFSTRFWMRAAAIALAMGFAGFSLQWGNGMPTAIYVGLAAGAVALALIVGFRFVQRRATPT